MDTSSVIKYYSMALLLFNTTLRTCCSDKVFLSANVFANFSNFSSFSIFSSSSKSKSLNLISYSGNIYWQWKFKKMPKYKKKEKCFFYRVNIVIQGYPQRMKTSKMTVRNLRNIKSQFLTVLIPCNMKIVSFYAKSWS